MAMPKSEVEDFSPSATLIFFDRPIPLLRGPVPAGLSDNPSIGPFVFAFKDARSLKSAFRSCQSHIREQCEGGARIGCSISASKKCKPPWWKTLFGGTNVDFSERAQCEEREMSACVAASEDSCPNFATSKCLSPFRDARISSLGLKQVSDLITCPNKLPCHTFFLK
ncbi:hypothetical protein GIB67_008943 [Kingdonia uniflora]|uniref:Uncharacterized protein n=1 Tax=Kingdonia uniflora TaxID=39325 RepID=A0A7J7LVP4_9MAGN|nr:hypothetical protein GIB67_008943 [Kingdonia uniflora]